MVATGALHATRSVSLSTYSVLAALLLAMIPAGCETARGSDDDQPRSELGAVTLPLTTQVNGHAYRLRDALVYISGPVFTQLWDSGDTTQNVLSATLVTGDYSGYLFSGWTLERDDGAGGFARVNAELVSSPSVAFSIQNGATSTISYTFRTDGVIVKVGSGALRVTATVDEVAAACTPFAADCATGSWCPPTSLTGAPRACVAAGATPLGSPCASPLECVANASCIDVGGGPVCASLCPPSAFDGPCEGGGTCAPVGVEYGVCRPTVSAMPTP